MLQQRKTLSVAYVFLAVAVILVFFAWRINRRQSPATLTDRDAVAEMKLRVSQAVDSAASEFGIKLDYSPNSVESVELILAKLHNQHNHTPIADAELTTEALKWGGYVGEVIKTQLRCDWALDSAISGVGSLPIVYEDKSESFPVRWCYKQIVNGDEDNVWHKFTLLVIARDKPNVIAPNGSDAEGQP